MPRPAPSLERVDEVCIGFAVVRLGVHLLHDQADELRLIAAGNWISKILSARVDVRGGFAVVRLGVHLLHDQADDQRLIADGNCISKIFSASVSTYSDHVVECTLHGLRQLRLPGIRDGWQHPASWPLCLTCSGFFAALLGRTLGSTSLVLGFTGVATVGNAKDRCGTMAHRFVHVGAGLDQ